MKTNESIKIFGTHYKGNEIVNHFKAKITENLPEWERNIFRFILDWYDDNDYIEVQTSGSTGLPKKISLKKEHVKQSALATVKYFKLKENDNIWLCLPIKYIASKLLVVRAITGNLNLVYSKPESKPSIQIKNIDFTAMVPFQVQSLLESPAGIGALKNIKNLLVGGSNISMDLEEKLMGLNINAWHSYGMTETITHIALRNIKYESRFTPLPGVNLEVNESNQLIINYPARGIHNMWTNDIVQLYDDGSFAIVGRSDNVIITGGVKVHPEKVELLLQKTISKNFFVAGISDEKLGQKVVLIIEDSDKTIDIETINYVLTQKLSKYEIPSEIIFIDDFIFTQTLKIDKISTLKKIKSD